MLLSYIQIFTPDVHYVGTFYYNYLYLLFLDMYFIPVMCVFFLFLLEFNFLFQILVYGMSTYNTYYVRSNRTFVI